MGGYLQYDTFAEQLGSEINVIRDGHDTSHMLLFLRQAVCDSRQLKFPLSSVNYYSHTSRKLEEVNSEILCLYVI